MGLALLANLAAWDLGHLSTGGLMRHTQDTLATMQRLERYRGHFYNWYETHTLQPLRPLYISSVDSGNLAGHLLTLGAGLREQAEEKIFRPEIFAGLRDTVGILRDLAREKAALTKLDEALKHSPPDLRAAKTLLEEATGQAADIAASLAGETEELKEWSLALKRTCEAHLADILFLAPWLALQSLASGGRPAAVASAAAKLEEKIALLDQAPSLREIPRYELTLCPLIEAALQDFPTEPAASRQEEQMQLAELSRCLREGSAHARQRLLALESLAAQCDALASMDFTFLFDPARDLFSIGFNVTERRCDTSFYDLLASEARLCSYVAIALGQVPQDHWFSMGRLLVAVRGGPILISWSGSMFEYLMPLVVMPNYENTLLDRTCKAAVQQQIEYGHLRGVPWGVSESGYNRTDVQLNYQYRAFGVPGLGLKRGLAEDLVITPYATALALMIAPRPACENLQRMADEGREGAYGFYEAVDYTPSRLPPDETSATIRSFMAHHQGMSLLALVNVLQDYPMQRRFMACPLLKAADLLLQERVPKASASMRTEDL